MKKMKEIKFRKDPVDRRPLDNPFKKALLAVVNHLFHFLWPKKYIGLENIPKKGPFLICPNHQSNLDIPIPICKFRPWVYMMAKEEMFRFAPLKWLVSAYGAFPVNREEPSISTFKRVFKVLSRGGVIGVFPEGTRVKKNGGPNINLVHSGPIYFAQKFGCPIVPVSIEYPGFKLFKKSRVFVGEPLTVGDLEKIAEGNRDLMSLSQALLYHIYKLQGIDLTDSFQNALIHNRKKKVKKEKFIRKIVANKLKNAIDSKTSRNES